MIIRHICDYCGGWTEKSGQGNIHQNKTLVALVIKEKDKIIEERRVCLKCIINALDKVLGPPRFGPAAQRDK